MVNELNNKISTNKTQWKKHEYQYEKKRNGMEAEHIDNDKRMKEERRKMKNDFAYLMNPDAAA